MQILIKPTIVISRCIEFAYCRYNGNIISSDFVKLSKNYINFTSICPEVEIGLGVPRDPIRIVLQNKELKLIQRFTGLEITDKMIEFAKSFFDSLENIDGFILKSKSPSCGTKNTPYLSSTKKGASKLGKGPGIFGKVVINNFPSLAIENEGRLHNFRIREYFLTKIYTFARFRKVKRSLKMNELNKFHASNKFLLMSYNQDKMREMGRIVGNAQKEPLEEVLKEYEKILYQIFEEPPKYTKNINVLMHMLGYFSNELSHEEKAYFLDELEKYRSGWIPLFVLTRLLRSWIVRFNQKYLESQTFFKPYPEKLMMFDLKDTWRGRDYW